MTRRIALMASDAINRIDFHLRRYAETRNRGACPACKGMLLCVARGMYRCESCRTAETEKVDIDEGVPNCGWGS